MSKFRLGDRGHRALDVSSIAIEFLLSHEDYDDKHKGARRRRDPKDDLSRLKIETSKFNGNLKLENYLY